MGLRSWRLWAVAYCIGLVCGDGARGGMAGVRRAQEADEETRFRNATGLATATPCQKVEAIRTWLKWLRSTEILPQVKSRSTSPSQ